MQKVKSGRVESPLSKESLMTVEKTLIKVRNAKGYGGFVESGSEGVHPSDLLSTAGINSNAVKQYDEYRDDKYTTSLNVSPSNLCDITPRSPVEKKQDISDIISYNKTCSTAL